MDNEPQPQWDFQGEAGASSGCDVDGQLCVFPVFELVLVHEERAARYLPDPHITAADPEFSFHEAHGL
jgi:hypothetical protein